MQVTHDNDNEDDSDDNNDDDKDDDDDDYHTLSTLHICLRISKSLLAHNARLNGPRFRNRFPLSLF